MDFIKVRYPKARKEYECACCDKKILPRETYAYHVNKDGSDFYSFRFCLFCDAYSRELCRLAGEYEWTDEMLYYDASETVCADCPLSHAWDSCNYRHKILQCPHLRETINDKLKLRVSV